MTPQIRPAALAEKGGGGPCLSGAVEGAAILGFATYGPFRAGPGYARSMEHTIILAPQARGLRLGRALMARLEGGARAAGKLNTIFEDQVFYALPPTRHFPPKTTDKYFFREDGKKRYPG
jgi:L-amino acid N-acyltransferase YncA